jgi:hypothetical protein
MRCSQLTLALFVASASFGGATSDEKKQSDVGDSTVFDLKLEVTKPPDRNLKKTWLKLVVTNVSKSDIRFLTARTLEDDTSVFREVRMRESGFCPKPDILATARHNARLAFKTAFFPRENATGCQFSQWRAVAGTSLKPSFFL